MHTHTIATYPLDIYVYTLMFTTTEILRSRYIQTRNLKQPTAQFAIADERIHTRRRICYATGACRELAFSHQSWTISNANDKFFHHQLVFICHIYYYYYIAMGNCWILLNLFERLRRREGERDRKREAKKVHNNNRSMYLIMGYDVKLWNCVARVTFVLCILCNIYISFFSFSYSLSLSLSAIIELQSIFIASLAS